MRGAALCGARTSPRPLPPLEELRPNQIQIPPPVPPLPTVLRITVLVLGSVGRPGSFHCLIYLPEPRSHTINRSPDATWCQVMNVATCSIHFSPSFIADLERASAQYYLIFVRWLKSFSPLSPPWAKLQRTEGLHTCPAEPKPNFVDQGLTPGLVSWKT